MSSVAAARTAETSCERRAVGGRESPQVGRRGTLTWKPAEFRLALKASQAKGRKYAPCTTRIAGFWSDMLGRVMRKKNAVESDTMPRSIECGTER